MGAVTTAADHEHDWRVDPFVVWWRDALAVARIVNWEIDEDV